jgi:hypothetical protein
MFEWSFWRWQNAGGWKERRPPRLPQRTIDGDWISDSIPTWRRRREDGQWEYKQDGITGKAYCSPRSPPLPAEWDFSPPGTQERPMTVWIYVKTATQVGDAKHIKVFANADSAEKWFAQNDPKGVAFEYEVLE